TTMTTILGFLPALLSFGQGSNLWRPLAIAVISGLVISSLSSGFLIPLLLRHAILPHRRK
ncbi:MAG: efflux RND transporter permease subunit, partial [Spirochaetes bacterium]|nr:efflux RND transporter permease subunit [Spirochaetota bacterium]